MDPQAIGRKIKHFRELAGLSKSELARRVEVSPTAVNNWEENGVVPRIEVAHKLSEVLEVSFVQLMSSNRKWEPDQTSARPKSEGPELSRGERLDQHRRQIAALFDVPAERVDIVIRT
ncbi:helix-turn-helix transcriptional regulator [Novosphingopyxis iocasae]|uniref:helix-turn-helix transcriptional regulator n=1 Tax=Novosphingopyxis iocasae TaxID=2762729 RepID=UPI0016518729|nr:helix-turn-helix transcriptional regulator [Novosphingopyxis iocasae]